MKQESQKFPQFSAEQVKQVLGSPEGKQLIALLGRDGGKGMQQAAEEYRKGNLEGAQEALKPLIQTAEAEALLKKLNGR
ncbi:MAG: hypothetical protein ACI4V3_02700 [Faecousia sp.]